MASGLPILTTEFGTKRIEDKSLFFGGRTLSDVKFFDYREYPKKLNLGCGFDIKDGYLNIDFQDYHQPDLVADVTELKMLPNNYYEEIVAQDVLEHIEREKTESVLIRWGELLRVGGKLYLRVPSIIDLAELLKKNQDPMFHKELVQCLFGTQHYTGDYHYTGFTKPLIHYYLYLAGFQVLDIKNKDEWLFEVFAKKISSAVLPKKLVFSTENYNASPFIVYGVSFPEKGFSWTDGVESCIFGTSDFDQKSIKITISILATFEKQKIKVLCNDNEVYSGIMDKQSSITFTCKNIGHIEIKFLLPDALAPCDLSPSINADKRKLALAISEILFQ